MLVARGTLGNVATDEELAAAVERHRERGSLETVSVDRTERRRSRFRTTTDAGTEVGVVVESTDGLSPGDVLLVDDERAIVVAFESMAAVVVDLPDDPVVSRAGLVELGHVVGNKHWELATREGLVYVALGPDGERRRHELEALLPAAADTWTEQVAPELFDGTVAAHSHDHERIDEQGDDGADD